MLVATLVAEALGQVPGVPAFPGAEGHGSMTRGGRGGPAIAVTNLDDSGPGSLRAAVEAEGARIVVFRVSGTIVLESPLRISNPYITIAGQTAPGDGIALRKHPIQIDADEVVIRYVRVRLGDESGDDADAVSSRYHKNIILDHLSASWSIDEAVSLYHGETVTVQWTLISESLYGSNHIKGSHGFGGIWGSNYSTYHHNLLAHHSSRNPRFASGCGYTDHRNNVVFNWGINSAYGGEKQQQGNPKFSDCVVNMVGNYYKPGPATIPGAVSHRIANPSSRDEAADFGKWFIAGNFMQGNAAVTQENWQGGVQAQHGDTYVAGLKLDEPWPAMPIREQSAEEAYRVVLSDVGASLPKRDALDRRIIEETRRGEATYEGTGYKEAHPEIDASRPSGIIDSPQDVGGWPELAALPAPSDSDNDGMPDAWEEKFGLDPRVAADPTLDSDRDGYTNIEEFLNGTDPIRFVDYTAPENNRNTLR
ncbi:MAG: pectate lyase [Acidobacteria bacterium]|nr:pectate lyase [Acidobacteriota bacterium]MDA1236695.1 pectate lyase [Acidobacteriota bacterium]